MSVDLSDFVDVLRREVTPPGGTSFATVSDEIMTGYLADAFWEAYLDAVAPGISVASPIQMLVLPYSCDADGIVTPRATGGADMDRLAIALIVIYAGLKILRNQLINSSSATKTRAKAGPVEFETDVSSSANLLTEMAKQLQAVKDRLLTFEDQATETFIIDGYAARQALSFSSIGGYAGYVGDTIYAALGAGSLQLVDLGGEGV